MAQPDVSIIICTYNRGSKLLRALEDLDRQTSNDQTFTWELILVDNNSTDGTRSLVDSNQDRWHYSLHYVFEPRQGKSFALNTGIAASKGDFLVFTDDDVVLDSHWVSAFFKASRDKTYNAFGGRVLPILETALPPWLAAKGPYRVIGGPLVSHDRGERQRPYQAGMFVPAGCNMAFRRDLVDRFGGFNTELGFMSKNELIVGEDTDIMFRFKRNGEEILYVPDALVHHPVPEERLRKSYFRRYSWGAGRGAARRTTVREGTRRWLGIPRWHIKTTVALFFKLMTALIFRNPARIFHHELQLAFQLGMLYEYYSQAD